MTKDEALRLALKAMKVNNSAWKHLADSGDAGYWEAEEQGYYQLNEQAITAVEAALEAKDEPVAWMSEDEHTVYTSKQVDGCFQHDHIPLYTTPPQRTWVGLTDEEISELIRATHNTGSFVRAIEAKLKQKNFKE